MNVSQPIADAVYRLKRHDGVLKVGEPDASDEITRVCIDVQVPLPSRSKRAGVSSTGVQEVETCWIVFGHDYPLSAPWLLLREDFPLDLPHINPHQPDEPVSPCVFEGALDELLHRFGLDAIIDQLIDWLSKAAAGTLLDLEHGWEPTRRDRCPSTIVYSAERVANVIPSDGSVLTIGCRYVTVEGSLFAIFDDSLAPQAEPVFNQTLCENNREKWSRGNTVAFIAGAPFVDGKPQVFKHYQPETVCDLPTLLTRAAELGIDYDALEQSLIGYYRRSIMGIEQDPRTWQHGLYVIVLLAVQRPVSLVGSPGRSLELLPYVVRYDIDSQNLLERTTTVHSAFHAHALSPALLALTSGIPHEPTTKPLVMVGCGSLGSKIALHLARAGFGNMTLIDNESLSPHNIARHAIIDGDLAVVPPKKTEQMKAALEQLSHDQIAAHDEDAVKVFVDAEIFGQVIPNGAPLIIETTASLKVLAAESRSAPLDMTEGRLVRVAMYGQGRSVVALLEGPGRESRVDDLAAYLFECCRNNSALRDTIAGNTSEPTELFVGENCRSLTTPMSDATVSRASSIAALQLERWLIDGLPDTAMLCTGISSEGELGMTWNQLELGPTKVINVVDEGGWQVRILRPVVQTIHEDSRRWMPCETGGALVGYIAYESRTIIIAGLVDAPRDSVRESARFILGTDGLVEKLRGAHQASLGHLSFIGTWHSHPRGGKHSEIDRETLHRIAEDAGGLPAVSLVWTPTELLCAIDRW